MYIAADSIECIFSWNDASNWRRAKSLVVTKTGGEHFIVQSPNAIKEAVESEVNREARLSGSSPILYPMPEPVLHRSPPVAEREAFDRAAEEHLTDRIDDQPRK